jgi:putative sigma-54 modulation protein
MTSEEAILQMEMLEHSFFVFSDPDTGKANIVYKRNDGGYGLLITE